MTVFGPGVGECIVMHLGNGDWIIVDSCMLPAGTQPVALDYLRSIGVDPAKSVRTIVTTHWHDDHIQGMATLLRECPNAQFVMSVALASQQFIQLALEVDAQNRLVKYNSSASEFTEILEVLESRTRSSYAVGPSMYAQDGTRIFHGGYDSRSEVWALSPSAATVTNASTNLAELLLTPGKCRRFKHFSPNDLSVAILVRAGAYDLLLGADLENTAAHEFGWKAVLSSTVRPMTQAYAFKIAHHGSANADHDGIWLSMLVNQPAVVVTPYAKLTKPLPRGCPVYC
ncbi:MAG: MBL fold metallo-hydrolase [Planctomycetota bacterium]